MKYSHPLARLALLALASALLLTGCTTASPEPSPSQSGSEPTVTAGPPTPGSAQSPVSTGSPAPSVTPTTPTTPATRELPRGGTMIFPRYRLVGYSGAPGSPALGRLGVGDLDARVTEMDAVAKPYAKGRQILPVLELITTVVHGSPGSDGMYRSRMTGDVIKTYLKAARRHHAILLLNIQPGRATFIDEVKAYRKWLKEPDVGLALDPEWAVSEGQVPGRVFGRTSGKELDQVSAYVSSLVRSENLPEKVMVYHQLHVQIVSKESGLQKHPGVVAIKSVDGIGAAGDKVATWKRVIKKKPKFVHPGFKLFYEEDRDHGKLMTPAQVMALKPTPEYILYE